MTTMMVKRLALRLKKRNIWSALSRAPTRMCNKWPSERPANHWRGRGLLGRNWKRMSITTNAYRLRAASSKREYHISRLAGNDIHESLEMAHTFQNVLYE